MQPDGPSFTVEGHEVSWQNWEFRIGFTPREGLVLHTISYSDGERERPILHRAIVCEMVVPYGDPSRAALTARTPSTSASTASARWPTRLELGCDCLGTIQYFDAHLTDSRGRPVTIKNAVCLHEEDAGMLWKHTDWRTDQTEVRRSRRLVGVVHRHRRQLRVRLLLVLLPGRLTSSAR